MTSYKVRICYRFFVWACWHDRQNVALASLTPGRLTDSVEEVAQTPPRTRNLAHIRTISVPDSGMDNIGSCPAHHKKGAHIFHENSFDNIFCSLKCV